MKRGYLLLFFLFCHRNPHFVACVLRIGIEIDLDIRGIGVFIAGGRKPFCNNAPLLSLETPPYQ